MSRISMAIVVPLLVTCGISPQRAGTPQPVYEDGFVTGADGVTLYYEKVGSAGRGR